MYLKKYLKYKRNYLNLKYKLMYGGFRNDYLDLFNKINTNDESFIFNILNILNINSEIEHDENTITISNVFHLL